MDAPQESYADRVLRQALLAASGGLDLDTASDAVNDALGGLAKIAKQLNAEPFKARTVTATCACGAVVKVEVGPKPEELARAGAHVAKVIDEITRLMAFAKGQPDSRPEGTRDSRDVLRWLTAEQLARVQAWVEEAAQRAEAERP